MTRGGFCRIRDRGRRDLVLCVPFPLSLSLPIPIPPGRTTQEAPLVLLPRLSRLRCLCTVSTCAPLHSLLVAKTRGKPLRWSRRPGCEYEICILSIMRGANPFDARIRPPSSLKSKQIKKRETEPLVSLSPRKGSLFLLPLLVGYSTRPKFSESPMHLCTFLSSP